MFGRDPLRVDILTDLPGVTFALAWSRRTSVTLDGQEIPLIAVEDLIANKNTVGRLQDLADGAALQAMSTRHRGK